MKVKATSAVILLMPYSGPATSATAACDGQLRALEGLNQLHNYHLVLQIHHSGMDSLQWC